MSNQKTSVSTEYLQERVAFLEESNQRFMSILEMLASSSEFQTDLTRAKDGMGIFSATTGQLRRLFAFQAICFLDSLADGSFELVVADPGRSFDTLQALVEACMLDGTFAWALNRNQAVLVPTETGDTLILQVVATQSRIRGMFAGTLPGSSAAMDAASLNALSIVLYTCAYALESTYLYGMLHDHTQHLEERVQLRTRDLEEARFQAEAASLAKSNFLANMSHEIRTPMNGVMGMTELLLRGGLTPQKEKLYLHAIKDSAESLMTIINDILDFSKIEAGKITLENMSFNPRDVVERCLEGLLVKIEEKGLRIVHQIHSSVPACLVGDQGRLRQVLTNLVGNAIKFCQQGQITVDVRMVSQVKDDVFLHIRVSDTGIGIAAEACQRIFKQFEQADSSTTKKFGGTGLGLAICKRLVELMDGTIWVESHLGSGSSFHFTVRFLLGKEEVTAQDSDAEPVPGQSRLRPLDILLADDVEINRALVQAILEPYGHRIICAEDGRKAVEQFQSSRFELVLMDVQMPEMDGLQATRAIRDYERSVNRTAPTPIVAMTAFAGSEDRQTCLDAGMNDYLSKPIKADQLLRIVNSYCAVHTERSEVPAASVSTALTPELSSDGPENDISIFAHSELLERLGGRAEMIPRLVGLFFKGVKPRMEELVTALATEDSLAVKQITHAIKGTAGNISAHRMQKTAEIMEKAAAAGDLTQASQQLAVLQQEFQSFSTAVINLGMTIDEH